MWFTTQKKTSGKARELVQQGAVLLDVRTHDEFASGHIPGAKHIPLHELPSRLGELGHGKKQVVVYCRSGGRSASAAQILRQVGHDVHDLGGMHNW